jgi:hypothetical protein
MKKALGMMAVVLFLLGNVIIPTGAATIQPNNHGMNSFQQLNNHGMNS